MKLNIKSTNSIIVAMIISTALIITFQWIDLPLTILFVLLLSVLGICVFSVLFFQKTEKPVCKHCNKTMDLVQKKLIYQDEIIRNRKFVFIYKYAYEYQCPKCSSVIHINKTEKK